MVLHYTNANLERSLALLTHGEVSSHYLIGDNPATIYQLVDESRRAWHAGDSQWEGRTWLNSTSIGIEIVNPGFTDTPTGRVWHPYSEAQIQALIVLLKDIVQRNGIQPRHIIGHSDIAPLRKLDPGPMFPGNAWPTPALASGPTLRRWRSSARFDVNPPSITWYQQQLARFGYAIEQTGELDVSTRHVLAAFQMRFRPQLFDGQPDAQTAAILQVLNSQR